MIIWDCGAEKSPQRRIAQCDEGVPKCTLCTKRRLDCLYPPDPDSPGSSGARDGSDSGIRTPGASLPTRMLEMRLWHQYLTSTYLTLSQDGLSIHHLSITIPQMATSHPFLLDSILALTALHLASIEDDNRQTWIEAATRYQSQTCAEFGKVIAEITYDQYEPAFVASVFIMLYAQGFPVISRETHSDALSQVLAVRTLISGCATIFTKLNDMGIEGELGGWLSTPDTEENLDSKLQNKGHIPIEDTEKLFDLHKKIIQSLNELGSTIETNTSPNRTLFKATWQFLHQAIEPWPKIGAHGGVMAWPLFIAEAFITLVREGDWLARILFLHYASAMRLMSNRWYVRDWGRRLLHATVQPLEEIPPIWRDTISWMKEGIEPDQTILAYRSADTD
ncbi:hypothetical protein N7478_001070 [Penicillium angulare]|uniref:uncharacterized protein n=1 Tax=Penicillium angulare TaxID=116970 RepID=UPI0025416B12|nr:uncharacterized protein N7478_001070 [Penicillium angulare]KAJ5291819.1 hypothetical protein N7478_001070 [Penicillium angulare]